MQSEIFLFPFQFIYVAFFFFASLIRLFMSQNIRLKFFRKNKCEWLGRWRLGWRDNYARKRRCFMTKKSISNSYPISHKNIIEESIATCVYVWDVCVCVSYIPFITCSVERYSVAMHNMYGTYEWIWMCTNTWGMYLINKCTTQKYSVNIRECIKTMQRQWVCVCQCYVNTAEDTLNIV